MEPSARTEQPRTRVSRLPDAQRVIAIRRALPRKVHPCRAVGLRTRAVPPVRPWTYLLTLPSMDHHPPYRGRSSGRGLRDHGTMDCPLQVTRSEGHLRADSYVRTELPIRTPPGRNRSSPIVDAEFVKEPIHARAYAWRGPVCFPENLLAKRLPRRRHPVISV